MRVAAGAIARKVVPGLSVRGALIRIGEIEIDRARWDWNEVDRNPFFSPDAGTVAKWEPYLDEIRKAGSSVGAVIEVVADGCAGRDRRTDLRQARPGHRRGADVDQRREGRRDRRRVWCGEACAARRTPTRCAMGNDGKPVFLSNNAGGILGGIATGQPVVARFAVKPTSSILTPVKGVTRSGEDIDLVTKGRHDPCVGIRAVPIGEAMLAIVIADHFLRHRAQMGGT